MPVTDCQGANSPYRIALKFKCCLPRTRKPMSESTLLPYRIYITPEVVEELNDAATETGKETGNKVAAAIVSDCIPVWIALQKSLEDHRGEFIRKVINEIESGQAARKSR